MQIPHNNLTPPRLSGSQALRQFTRHSAQHARNYASHLLDHPSVLKNNAIIFSTLILVLSRIGVAHHSAQKTKNTPEGPHRYREAIRTTMRELGGWTFNYMVFRTSQNLVERGIRKLFGIKEPDKPLRSLLTNLRHELSAARHKHPSTVAKYLPKLENLDTFQYTDTAFHHLQTQKPKLYKRMRQFFKFWNERVLRQTPKDFSKLSHFKPALKALYEWLPLAIGAIPTLYLGGYILERFTRDHSTDVANTLSQRLFPQTNSAAASSTPPTDPISPIPMIASQQQFQSYLNQVQQKKRVQTHYGPIY